MRWRTPIALDVFGLRHPKDVIAAVDPDNLAGRAIASVRGKIDGRSADGLKRSV